MLDPFPLDLLYAYVSLLIIHVYCIYRDRDISRESALRKAAESRLEQLVDMYGDPMVMEELRERLPRAGKGDVKEMWGKELELMKRDASESYS